MLFLAYFLCLVTSSFNCGTTDEPEFTETMNINAKSIESCKDSKDMKFNAGTIEFSPGTFDGFNNLEMITIKATQKATFYKGSISNLPKFSFLTIDGSADTTLVQFFDNAATNNAKLSSLTIIANKLTLGYEAFRDCSGLRGVLLNVKNYDFESSAFCNCGLKEENIQITDYSSASRKKHKCYLGCCDKNDDGDGGSSSSGKDNDSGDSARILGNIAIETAYLGTSSNIVFNLRFLSTFMSKLRKTFGRVVPSPEIVHSAIWVGSKNAKDDSIGAVFVYGRYFNNNKQNEAFLWGDGAKGYSMSLADFKKKFSATKTMKLNIKKDYKLLDFIDEIKKSGNWNVKDYNWPTNNCQHFTVKLIEILQASRNEPNNDDWANLPKSVLNALKSNE